MRPELEISHLWFLPCSGPLRGRPNGLGECHRPGGFPRKPAFRLFSAESGLQLPAPLLAIGKFPVPLWARCVQGRELAARGPSWSYMPGPGRVSTSSASRRMEVLGQLPLQVVPAAGRLDQKPVVRGRWAPGAGRPACSGSWAGAVDRLHSVTFLPLPIHTAYLERWELARGDGLCPSLQGSPM